MDLAAFWIAIVGLALGLLNAGWNVYVWRRSGHSVKCRWDTGFSFLEWSGEITDRFLSIDARNEGRSAVQITQYGIRIHKGGIMLVPSPNPAWPKVPHTLEAGHEKTFMMPLVNLLEEIEQEGLDPKKLRPYVKLGSGQWVYAKPLDLDKMRRAAQLGRINVQ